MNAAPELLEKVSSLESELTAKTKQIHSQENQIQSQKQRIWILEEMLRLAKLKHFASSSEKLESPQQALFNEAEDALVEPDQDTDQKNESEETVTVPAHARKKQTRVSIPDALEREERIYDLSDEEKICPHDGSALKCMGEDTHEQLEVIPAQMKAIRHIRKKYACPCCDGYLVTAKKPKQAIEKSIASPGLLAYVATNKYADALPLYRQTQMFKRIGVELDRTSLANWMIKSGELIQPLFNRIQDHLLEQSVIHMDETPLQVLNEPGKPAQSKSYMWVMASQPSHNPIVLFHYSPSRGQETPNTLLAGYDGALMVDGYAGYQPVCDNEALIRLGCWAHARRKFIDAQSGTKSKNKKPGRAEKALLDIQKLYQIEKASKALSPQARHQLRQDKAKPILDKLKIWLAKSLPQVPPKTAIGKALAYLNNQWPYLIQYLENGAYPIDNNLAENKIRPFVVGRKNWLFSNSQAGAKASANLWLFTFSGGFSFLFTPFFGIIW